MKYWMVLIPLVLLTPLAPVSAQESQSPEPPTAPTQEPAREPATDPASAPKPAPPPVDIVAGEAFVNANGAYEQGDFSQAIQLYEQVLKGGSESGHLHYNLGNAYLRNGELGRAIASYRRSQVFLPRDQDVKANLLFARKSAKDALAPPGPTAIKKTLFFWHYSLSRSELGTIVVVVNLLLWLILMLRIYRQGSEILRWTFFVLLLVLLATGGSLALRHLNPLQIAVIVPQEIDVRSGTNLGDTVLFKLHAGTEVRVVDRRDKALRIALPEEARGGWIASEHAEVVQR